jgi:hypothetical protein
VQFASLVHSSLNLPQASRLLGMTNLFEGEVESAIRFARSFHREHAPCMSVARLLRHLLFH